eukprot:m.108846 g.108846  ORF g.108846 m.108846 type:complete len:674 (-) comp15224_c0_seq1:67-2088(-)
MEGTSIPLRQTNRMELLMSRANVDSGTREKIRSIAHNTCGSWMIFYNCKLGAEGGEAVAEALRTNTTLQILHLFNNHLGADGGRALASAIRTNTTLHTLYLNKNNLGPVGGRAIARALEQNTTLKKLNLNNNNIGHASGALIAQALGRNQTLQSVYLWQNNFTVETGHAFANALKTNQGLEKLDIHGNRFPPEIGRAFADALDPFRRIRILWHSWDATADEKECQTEFDRVIQLKRGRFMNAPQIAETNYTLFTMAEVAMATRRFASERLISDDGTFGGVYRGDLRGTRVAVKLLKNTGGTEGFKQFVQELHVLARYRHDNLLPLLGAVTEEPDQLCLVYSLRTNGSLRRILDRSIETTFTLPWKTRFAILIEVARALNYLHNVASPPLVHRDVKTANILLDHHMSACLGDFGAARMLGSYTSFSASVGPLPSKKSSKRDVSVEPAAKTPNTTTTASKTTPAAIATTHFTQHVVPSHYSTHAAAATRILGTPGYIDPEYAHTGVVTCSSDIYSMGVVMAEVLSGRKAYDGRIDLAFIFDEMREQRKPLDAFVDISSDWLATGVEAATSLLQLTLQCLAPKSAQRPDTCKLLEQLETLGEQFKCTPELLHAQTDDTWDDNDSLCVVCMLHEANHAFVPCGHCTVCGPCAQQLRAKRVPCPICRKKIQSTLRVFR